jgi:hypothetical protein
MQRRECTYPQSTALHHQQLGQRSAEWTYQARPSYKRKDQATLLVPRIQPARSFVDSLAGWYVDRTRTGNRDWRHLDVH